MSGRWGFAVTCALAAWVVAGGCAPYPAAGPGSTPAGQAPPNTTPRGTTKPASGSTAGGSQGSTSVPADTVPSRDAVQVLSTIPEPIPQAEQVPPPESARTPAGSGSTGGTGAAVGGAALAGTAAGSAAVHSEAPSDTAIPVPAPTYALGLEPSPPPDTTAADTSAGGGAAPGATAAAGAAGAAAGSAARGTAPGATATGAKATPGPPPGLLAGSPPDTCWRVQISAPDDGEKSESVRSAAASLLVVPMVVEKEGGLFKVRTRDCMSRSSAEEVRRRAVDTGFEGAFRFVGKRR